ncbi:MAG TPA: DUF1800 domain-containing protein [Planctomycetota bacterium]|nr:DUF1800 domain-containing protein [Planctomycetota bacterium]
MKPYAGAFGRAEAGRLLRRAAFVARPEDVDRAVRDGLDATAERLLADLSSRDADAADVSADAREAALRGSDDGALLAGAWLLRLAETRRPLRERLALFWHGHFTTALRKVADGAALLDQIALFRRLGGGPFADLTAEVGRDPAMLRYLDGAGSTASAPNENYGRELLELFTVGTGAYDERDVREAARAFTGWSVRGGRARFSAAAHDAGLKTLLGATSPFDADGASRLCADHPATARRLAGKLARAFVADAPPPATVDALAATWRSRRGDVGRVLGDLFRSEAFFAPGLGLAVTRSPVLFAVAALRLDGARPAAIDVARRVARMGEAPLDPPTVKGYDGGASWLNPATRLARLDFIASLPETPATACEVPEGAAFRDFAADVLGRALDPAEAAALDRAAPENVPGAGRRRLRLLLTHPEFDRC